MLQFSALGHCPFYSEISSHMEYTCMLITRILVVGHFFTNRQTAQAIVKERYRICHLRSFWDTFKMYFDYISKLWTICLKWIFVKTTYPFQILFPICKIGEFSSLSDLWKRGPCIHCRMSLHLWASAFKKKCWPTESLNVFTAFQ